MSFRLVYDSYKKAGGVAQEATAKLFWDVAIMEAEIICMKAHLQQDFSSLTEEIKELRAPQA